MREAVKVREECFGSHKVIDVDTHLSEPHDLWTSRAPQSIRDRVPQVKMHQGKMSWVIDGDKCIGEGAAPASTILPDGTRSKGMGFTKFTMADVHPASSEVKARVAMMKSCGISAQIVYPNILGFGGQNAVLVEPGLRLECTRIFNDAMAEMQVDSGQSIFPMALLPWWDVRLAVEEIQRIHANGLRGVNINSDPHTCEGPDGNNLPDLSDPHWDPLWEACAALKMPVNFHIGGSEQSMDWYGQQGWPSMSADKRAGLGGAMLFFNNGRVLGNLIYSGLLDRHPDIKFVSVESGIGWIPFLLEALDHQYAEVSGSQGLQMLPSEYFRRNFFACFWFERRNLGEMIKSVGVDNVLFETDFPHPTCLYPVDNVIDALSGLTFDEQGKVLSGNAARLYDIKI